MLSNTFINLLLSCIPFEFLKVVIAGGTILYTTDTLRTFDDKTIRQIGSILYLVAKIGIRVWLILQGLELLELFLIIFELL